LKQKHQRIRIVAKAEAEAKASDYKDKVLQTNEENCKGLEKVWMF
jgi:hypothetical protein